ncbi:MAG: hypothetical protein PHV42_02525 [Candidatus Pacebacteria bacterium]|nr:hypothetical protein [Candidatus Paceibacterota bacterium]
MDIKEVYESKKARHIFFGICIAIIALLIFQAGIFVGFKKAEFSEQLGENYYQAFGTSSRGPVGFFREDIAGGHGASGKIVRINLPTLVISNSDNTEKVIIITDDTLIRRFRDQIAATDIKVGDLAIVLGEPDTKGQISAKLIRLLPPPPSLSPSPKLGTTTNTTNQ